MDGDDDIVSPDLGAVLHAGIRCRQHKCLSRGEPTEDRGHKLSERFGCSASRVDNSRRAKCGQSHHSHRGLYNTWSGCRTATAHRGAALGQGGRHSSNARTRSANARTRHDAVIETATSTYVIALDDDDQATAKLYVQKAVQVPEKTRMTIYNLQLPLAGDTS